MTRDPCSSSSSNGDADDDVMSVEVSQTAARTNRVYILVYKTIFYLLFRVGGPLAALIVLNSRLLKTLRHQKRWRRSRQTTMTSRVSAWRRENVTAMLVTVVTVFIICELPDPSLRMVYAAAQMTSDPSDDFLLTLRYVNTITNALLAFNSSINFVIYLLVGRTFRRVFIGSLTCRRHAVINSTAPNDASCVAMATPRRRHAAVVKETATRTVLVATNNTDAVAVAGNSPTSHCCHDNDRQQNHVTVVSVDVEK